jgi:hypothetical protein
VTTCRRPEAAHLERARRVADRLGVGLVERAGLEAIFAATGAEVAYVVGRDHDALFDREGHGCFVQPALLTMKLQDGRRHPYLRALAGGVDGEPPRHVVDATLGLAADALHAAGGLGCRVTGIEKSPVLACLLEEGVARLATLALPGRIEVVEAEATAWLAAQPDDSADVVVVDPMMSRPKRSTPSFAIVRRFAWPARASAALLVEARRVARRRVVLKLGRGAPLPDDAPYAFPHAERGNRVVYHVHPKLEGAPADGRLPDLPVE